MAQQVNTKLKNLAITQDWYSINETKDNLYFIQQDFFIRKLIKGVFLKQGYLVSDIIIKHMPQLEVAITEKQNSIKYRTTIKFLYYRIPSYNFSAILKEKRERKLRMNPKVNSNLLKKEWKEKDILNLEQKITKSQILRRIMFNIKNLNNTIRYKTLKQKQDQKRKKKAFLDILRDLTQIKKPYTQEVEKILSRIKHPVWKAKLNKLHRPSIAYLISYVKTILLKRNSNSYFQFDIRQVRRHTHDTEILAHWLEYNMVKEPRKFKTIMYKTLNKIKKNN